MSAPRITILCIGNEVVDGRITNTNASWLSQQLKDAGFLPQMVTSCRDIKEEIVEMLQFLSERSEHIITSGGLGPTTDDLTRESVAAFVGVGLEENREELKNLEELYRKRGRKLDENSKQQAYLPAGSVAIPNPVGTAPGFISETPKGKKIFSLPGVPKELYHLFDATVLPELLSLEDKRIRKTDATYFHCFGIPESVAGKRIAALEIAEDVIVGYRPHFPVLEVRLEGRPDSDTYSEAVKKVSAELGDVVFSQDIKASLLETVHKILQKQARTVAVAESCTGGLLGKMLTSESGSSSYFLGGMLTYSNELKEQLLGVSHETLSTYGAVSPQTAKEMAKGAVSKCGSDIAVSITGIAGPNGGTEEKPVGLFYIGLATPEYLKAFEFFFLPNDRDYIRTFAAFSAIDTIRRFLTGLPYLGTEK